MDKKSSAEIDVEVQVAPEFAAALSESRLRAVAEQTLRQEKAAGQVTLVITDDRAIQDLNRTFLGVDAPTDVLAFSAQEGGEPFVVAPEAEAYLGDVIISYPRALAQAEEIGHSAGQEISLLIVHGLLHLLGYDHADEDDRARMWARQDSILGSL